MDLFEKELMMPDSEGLVKNQTKTVSIFPVDNELLTAAEQNRKDEKDEHGLLLYLMRNRPVDMGDKFLLDILDKNMERIEISALSVALIRASDITREHIEKMGLSIEDEQVPFDVYKQHMTNGGVGGIEPDTYVYVVLFEYARPIEK